MRNVLSAVMFLSLVSFAAAEPIALPTYTVSDSWSYHVSSQTGNNVKDSDIIISIVRVGSDGMLVKQKPIDNPNIQQSSLWGPDWSRRRSVNGKETTINQPLSFPLDVGKTWRVDFTEANPNPQKMREMTVVPYKAVGWEDITVPAGTFHALKIEANGHWTADLNPRVLNSALVARQGNTAAATTENRVVQAVRVSGRYYKCFWYVPEVKRWVKSIEENYSSNDTLSNSDTAELESYQLAGTKQLDGQPVVPSPAAPPSAAPPVKPSNNGI